MNRRALLNRLAASQTNVRFSDLEDLVLAFGFRLKRTRGSHHLYDHPGLWEELNLQEARGEAKAYQVRQFLKLAERHKLELEGDE